MENKQLCLPKPKEKAVLCLPKSELSFLIADDEPSLVKISANQLNRQYPNCKLATATNGRELLDHASRERYDIIITDYRMPVINGLDAIKNLRAIGNKTPVIITTGTPDESVCRYADDPVNLVSLFEKPFQFEELKSEINKYLNL